MTAPFSVDAISLRPPIEAAHGAGHHVSDAAMTWLVSQVRASLVTQLDARHPELRIVAEREGLTLRDAQGKAHTGWYRRWLHAQVADSVATLPRGLVLVNLQEQWWPRSTWSADALEAKPEAMHVLLTDGVRPIHPADTPLPSAWVTPAEADALEQWLEVLTGAPVRRTGRQVIPNHEPTVIALAAVVVIEWRDAAFWALAREAAPADWPGTFARIVRRAPALALPLLEHEAWPAGYQPTRAALRSLLLLMPALDPATRAALTRWIGAQRTGVARSA